MRQADHKIEEVFLRRWSPRAMDGAPLKREDLLSLFEAARWAPSSANGQPWRFVYAIAGTPEFTALSELLAPGNLVWASKAGALVIVLSSRFFENGRPAPTHSFDTGAAWMSLALQGTAMGLVVHAMAGFDYERARQAANVPEQVSVEAMIAIGYPGRVDDLPEKLRERETPSGRRPVSDFIFEGRLS